MRHIATAAATLSVLIGTGQVCVRPALAAFPGENGRIAFAGRQVADAEIYSVNPDGSGLLQLTDNSFDEASPHWSADGTKIAFASFRNGDFDIYTMNADGTRVARLTFDRASSTDPAWSPDGTRIAFVRLTPGYSSQGIYVMNRDGSNIQQITGTGSAPAWSPDGSRIAFQDVSGAGYHPAIYTMKPDGTNRVQLTNHDGYVGDAQPDWSPDGRKIAFYRWTGTYDIYTMNSDGTGVANISKRWDSHSPAWSPDGSKIAFLIDTYQSRYDVFTMNAGGSGQGFLAGNAYEPNWGPRSAVATPPANAPQAVRKSSPCKVQVATGRETLGRGITARTRRPRFPSTGRFVVKVRCNQTGPVSASGEISLGSKRRFRVRPVHATARASEQVRLRLRLRPNAKRRLLAGLRRGGRVSAIFVARFGDTGEGAKATIEIKSFRP